MRAISLESWLGGRRNCKPELRDRLSGFLGLVPSALPAESPTAPAPQRIDHDDFVAIDEARPDISLIAHIAGRGDTPADQQG
jgi:hypothetical protein